MKLWSGTSGFSYSEWKGAFYPEDLPQSGFLAYYGEHLNSVEINNTFYRLPKADMLEKWRAQVPDDFRFVLKASQRITHHKRLKEASDPLEYLASTATGALGSALGPILFQLPPYFRKNVDRLRDFLATIPEDIQPAFEFRHESWFEDDTYEALAEADAALVTADTGEGEAPVVGTAPFGYARLRRPGYTDEELEEWARRFKEEGWSDLYVFFKHEDEATGPALAARFNGVW
ncbi:MAG: DUF72 domain-containing protein [Gemmatimonadetes bacterium]|nr:DUF72 domain-containing protein [Gemmatimonadota bacterium]